MQDEIDPGLLKEQLLSSFRRQLGLLEKAIDPTDTSTVMAWPQDGWLCVNYDIAKIKTRACNVLDATRFALGDRPPYEVRNGMDHRAILHSRQTVIARSIELVRANIKSMEECAV